MDTCGLRARRCSALPQPPQARYSQTTSTRCRTSAHQHLSPAGGARHVRVGIDIGAPSLTSCCSMPKAATSRVERSPRHRLVSRSACLKGLIGSGVPTQRDGHNRARHHRRLERLLGKKGAPNRAYHDRRLPRRLRDRPPQRVETYDLFYLKPKPLVPRRPPARGPASVLMPIELSRHRFAEEDVIVRLEHFKAAGSPRSRSV